MERKQAESSVKEPLKKLIFILSIICYLVPHFPSNDKSDYFIISSTV